MNDMGRRKFEDAFKDTFQDAELTPDENVWSKVEERLDSSSEDIKTAFLNAEMMPSENVWTNVALELEREAGSRMRRRLVFYKMLAAASIAFAMCVAGIGYYTFNYNNNTLLAENVNTDSATGSESSINGASETASQGSTSTSSHSGAEGNASNNPTPSSLERKSNTIASGEGEDTVSGSAGKNDASEAPTSRVATNVTPSSAQRNPESIEPSASAGNLKSQEIAASTVNANAIGKDSNAPSATTNTLPSKQGRGVKSNDEMNRNNAGNELALHDGQNSAQQSGTKENITRERSGLVAATKNGVTENTSASQSGNDNNKNADGRSVTTSNEGTQSTLASHVDTHAKQSEAKDQYALTGNGRPLAPIFVPEKVKVPEQPQSNADPFMLMMARLDDEARAIEAKSKKNKKDADKEQLWTSVGMSAGAYNTVNRSVSAEMASSAVRSATSQVKASGMSYSVGVSVGTKLSNRWVVQGGVNYMNQISDYTSNILVDGNGTGQFNALNASNANVLKESLSSSASGRDTGVDWAQTPPFGVSNTMEFISIPVEAGYLVLNKKVGIMLNAGVSTDLFLQNTESANIDGAGEATQTQERGTTESPFRDVNFIGLVGTEVSYKVGQRYRVALTPGIRYPFNSMYKSESQIQATPLTFDVGLKFRYIFQ